MRSGSWWIVGIFGLGVALSGCATAGAIPKKGTELPIGAATRAPSGFVDFCRRNPKDCDGGPAGTPVALTKETWDELNDVNVHFNKSIRSETDEKNYNRIEYWTYADDGYGDCEDFALEKRRALIKRGWPQSALSLATARNQRGELHAVLIAVTDHGDFVLDNATNFVDLWNKRPYQWVSLQEPDMPMVWHRAAATSDQTATAALR